MFTHKLINGLQANKEKCFNYIEGSLSMCTSLAPVIGYDKAAEIAHKAHDSGKTIREISIEEALIDDDELDNLLNPNKMIKPTS